MRKKYVYISEYVKIRRTIRTSEMGPKEMVMEWWILHTLNTRHIDDVTEMT